MFLHDSDIYQAIAYFKDFTPSGQTKPKPMLHLLILDTANRLGEDFSQPDWGCSPEGPLGLQPGSWKRERMEGSDAEEMAKLLGFAEAADMDFAVMFFFDQARTRGTDMRNPRKSRGLVTVSSDTDAATLFQAVKRLRGFTEDHPMFPQYADFVLSSRLEDEKIKKTVAFLPWGVSVPQVRALLAAEQRAFGLFGPGDDRGPSTSVSVGDSGEEGHSPDELGASGDEGVGAHQWPLARSQKKDAADAGAVLSSFAPPGRSTPPRLVEAQPISSSLSSAAEEQQEAFYSPRNEIKLFREGDKTPTIFHGKDCLTELVPELQRFVKDGENGVLSVRRNWCVCGNIFPLYFRTTHIMTYQSHTENPYNLGPVY